MIRGIYTSLNGMQTQKQMHEIIADNLANSNTSGYKSYGLIHQAYEERPVYSQSNEIGKINFGSEAAGTKFNFEQGALRETGNPLDISVSGQGFLPVLKNNGSVAYTRNGHFTLDKDGFIVNQRGEALLDSGYSPIYIGFEGINSINVLRNGELQVNGEFNTKIAAFEFPQGANITKLESDQFQPDSSVVQMNQNFQATINQGFIEQSNVSSVKASADMIQVMRNYETNEKAAKMQMDTVGMLMHLTDGL